MYLCTYACTKLIKVNLECCCISPGHYQQYDNMAYPETKGKSVVFKAWDTIKSFFVQAEKQKQLVVPTHEEMQEICLHIDLEEYKNILRNCELSRQFNIIRVAEEVLHIFYQLCLSKLHYHSDVHCWRAKVLPEVSLITCISISIYIYIYIYSADQYGSDNKHFLLCRK